MRIIITRPEPFASQLAEKLKLAGFVDVVCLPCVEIEPTTPPLSQAVEGRGGADEGILIFISRNAVIYGHQLINNEAVAAIGLGTKNELERYHQSVDIFPKQPPFNSEALLELSDLLNVKNKKITIIQGGEGRSLLSDTLKSRGAIITSVDVYTRKQPSYTETILQTTFNDIGNSIAICTSEELLQNLYTLGQKAKIDLSQLQLGVISAKMATIAAKAGFIKPAIIADSPNDKDIVWIMRSNKKLNSK